MIDRLERALARVPLVRRGYRRHAAALKRRWCAGARRIGRHRPWSFVEWLATYACDGHCPFCGVSAGAAAEDELTTAEVERLLDDLARLRVKRLLVSGGEPLVRADVPALMAHANRRGLQVGLVSHGHLVPDRWDELRTLRYFLYLTSIDGPASCHDRLRAKPGAFDRAMAGLARFASLGVPERIVNTIVCPETVDQLEELHEILLGTGATGWTLSPISSEGRAAGQSRYRLSGAELRRVADFMRHSRGRLRPQWGESAAYVGCFNGDAMGKPFFCGAGLTRCVVMPDGAVAGCQPLAAAGELEGNVRHTPLSRLWETGFARLRSGALRAECAPCRHRRICHGGCRAEWHRRGACLRSLWEEP